MTRDYQVTIKRYDEQVVPGRRLGRHAARDSRSAAYPYRPKRTVPIVSVLHERHAPILDQGDLGSCTGNAEVGALATSPLYDALPGGHAALDEGTAVQLYSVATHLDAYPGAWEPDDTGSDGTSVCKAAQQAGYLAGYTHAYTVDDVLQALMAGPVLFGIDWYASFDDPAPDGLVALEVGSGIRGGHEIVARGVDTARGVILCDNSWGTGYGAGGSFSFTYATAATLLASDGDAIVPVPLSAPAPVPVPVPGSPDQVFAADPRMATWAAHRHTGDNAYAARTWTAWRKTVTGATQ